jgi:hypothetical protein
VNRIKTIVIHKGKYTTYLHHGIRNEVGGFGGTADAGWSQKMGIAKELQHINPGEQYSIEINGVNKGIFTK